MKKIVLIFVSLLFCAICFSQTITITSSTGGKYKVNDGEIAPSFIKPFEQGANVKIEAVADDGYVFEKWNDGDMTNPKTIEVNTDVTYSAIFKNKNESYGSSNNCTITVTSGQGGKITPNGKITKAKGEKIDFTITPNKGFVIQNFKIDNKDVLNSVTNGQYNLTVTGNHIVSVAFREENTDKEYTINIPKDIKGGTIDPSGEQKKKAGEVINFTITPNEGYKVQSFKIDNIERKDNLNDNQYPLTVSKEHVVAVSFVEIENEPVVEEQDGIIIDIKDSKKYYVRQYNDTTLKNIVDSVYIDLDFLKLPNDTVFLLKGTDTILYSVFTDSVRIYFDSIVDGAVYDGVYAGVLDSLLHRLNVERVDTLTLFNSSQTLKSEASFYDLFVYEYKEDIPSEPLPIWVWILIGVVVLAVVIFVVLWFFVLKRKKEKDSETGSDGKDPNGKTGGSDDITDGAKSPGGGSNGTTDGAKSPSGGSNDTTGGTKSPSGGSNDTTDGTKSPSGGSNDTTGGAKSPSGDSVQPNPESAEISNLKNEIAKLKADLDNQKQNEDARVKNKVEEVDKAYKKKMEDYEVLKSKYINDIQKAKEDAETKIKNEYESKIKKLEKEKEDDKNKADRKYIELQNEKNKVEQKLKTVKDDCEASFQKEKRLLTDAKDDAEKLFKQKKQELEATSAELSRTKNNLTEAKEKIQHLEVSQKRYADTVSVVPTSADAASYAKDVMALIDIAGNIQKKAADLQNVKVEDPYYLYKASAIYERNISKIDMQGFYADAEMVSRGELVFNVNSRAMLYNAKNKSDVKSYFFMTYLEKFISALAIYNESLAGLYEQGYSKSDTSAFGEYRQKIESAAKTLGIKIEIPKLFEQAGTVGFDVKLVSWDGYEKNQIVEIESCLVYLEGGSKPSTKIKVKVQE